MRETGSDLASTPKVDDTRLPVHVETASETHLEFIQTTIARMAGNSFLLKGWTVTLTAAILAFAAQSGKPLLAIAGVFPTLAFWGLDAYYLKQERLYRTLYDKIRTGELRSSFTMNAQDYEDDERNNLWSTLRAPTVFWLHFVNLVVISATPLLLLYL